MGRSNVNALAAKLNKMKNIPHIGPCIGKVVKADPLTVSIADGVVQLVEGEELFVCESLKKRTCDAAISGGKLKGDISISNYSETVEGDVSIGSVSGSLNGSITISSSSTVSGSASYSVTGTSLLGSLSGTLEGGASGKVEISGISQSGATKITIDPKVKAGDEILVIPMEGEQAWIAVDRIV